MTRERFYGDFQQAAREMNLTVEHMHQVHVELKRAVIKFRTLDNSMDPSAVDSGTLANFGGTSAAGRDGSTTAGTKGSDHTLLFTDKDGQTVAEFSSSSKVENLIGEYQEDEEGNVTFAGQNGSQLSVNTDNLDHLLEQYKDEKEFITRPEVLYAPRTGTADFLQYAVDKGYDPITFEPMDETPNPHAQNVVNFNRMRNVVSDQLHNEPIRIQIRDAADTGLNAIPVLGTIKGAVELYTGRSMVTNEELSTVQKGFTVASMMPLTAAFRPVGKMFKGAGKSVDDVVEGIGNAPVLTRHFQTGQTPIIRIQTE
ncbi:pre-toxin TG domain-containing protein [Paenibacillus sp. F411]|uniref:pre-toxin TG domain-containing protein n=1 Tax=Paenibacillus sp. F411 TaxID=2820239 RepID=UPI001AAE90C7|nr:pre-toxin TG domain-containing protein [Paenibacillus sp. F411]MBO2945992.1 pre-toxin TG domain-containing protein [Paenibacillus sp. F411]